MRRVGFVLAVAGLLASSLAHSQVRQANNARDARTSTTDAIEARTGDPAPKTAPERRSLMGMVMGALIESAEQQARRQHTMRQLTAGNAAPGITVTPASPAPSSGIAAREQIAVESEP